MFLNYICYMEQQLKSELTKQLIIDTSFNLFYKQGFKTTSIVTIMNATNLTKGAFYHHFKNKKEIGLTVISNKLKQRMCDAMILPLLSDGNATEILEKTFCERLKSFTATEIKHGCPVNNLINEIGDTEEAYQLALRNIIDEWKNALIDIIERGKNEGAIKKDINSNATATYLISAFEGMRGIRKLYNDNTINEEYITALSHYINQIKV